MSDARTSDSNAVAHGASVKEHLVVQTAFLGDLLLSIPMLRHLRRISPDHKLTLLCRKGLGEWMMQSGLVDEVIEADKKNNEAWARVSSELRSRRFDLVVCPHESLRSLFLVSRLRAVRKIGYAGAMARFIFDERVVRPMHLPEALRQLSLLSVLDSEIERDLAEFGVQQGAKGGVGRDGRLMAIPEWSSMSVGRLTSMRTKFFETGKLSEALSERVFTKVSDWDLSDVRTDRKLAMLAPGSVWATKQWTESGYVEAAFDLMAQGYDVLLTGAPDERELCLRVAAEVERRRVGVDVERVSLVSQTRIIVMAGQLSLWESNEVMAVCNLVICNDSGAMHMAAAAGVPSVAVFGPTVLDLGYRPWQSRAAVVEVSRTDLKCRPCGKHGARKCPIGTHECMKRVSAQQVLNESRRVLQPDELNLSDSKPVT